MPGAHHLGANAVSAHGCWPGHNTVTGSGDVFINGSGACRTGDTVSAHTCPAIPETHGGADGMGSATVFINGMNATRAGDPCTCGGILTGASGNVIIGG